MKVDVKTLPPKFLARFLFGQKFSESKRLKKAERAEILAKVDCLIKLARKEGTSVVNSLF